MVFSAETLLKQLGGRRFIVMTGAKNFVKDVKNNRMWFRLPHARHGINFVQITYTPRDLYNMDFGRIRVVKGRIARKIISKERDVYFDQLQDLFTKHTGLHTKL